MQIRDLIPWGRHENRAPLARRIDGEDDRALTTTPHREEETTHPFLALHRQVNRLFDDVFRDFGLASAQRSWPSVEIAEDDKAVRVSAELPGLDEQDVQVEFDDGVLTIHGEKRSDIADRDRHYSEHFYGRFERMVPIPVGVNEDAISANFKKGVLTVTLPKSKAQRDALRRIPINK